MTDEEFAGLRHLVKLANDLSETLTDAAQHYTLDRDARIALFRYVDYREKVGL